MNKIYETDSYRKKINTTIESCNEENGKYFVTFEDTIFFPEEGGQYADTGVIMSGDKEIRLINGEYLKSKDAEASIRYEVDSFIEPGSKVECSLDWDLRYSRMQNHSGEHIISGLINAKYGFNNVGFHLSDDAPVTLTLDGVLTYEQAIEIEKEVNEVIYKNMPIVDSYPTKEELKELSYRSKIEIAGQVRLITIKDENETVDICACCAPHVHRTGEIGIVKVLSVTNFKGGVQIGILCGRRALEYINHQQDILSAAALTLSTHPDNVPGLITSHIEEINSLKSELSALREKEYLQIVEDMKEQDPHIIFATGDLSPANMKNIFNTLSAKFNGYVGVFAGSDHDGFRYYAGSADLDSKDLAADMRNMLGAKGGGSSEMIQGKVSVTHAEILGFWHNNHN